MKQGQLRGGKQTGNWKIFYPSGRTKAQGTYKDDLHGPWTYFYEDGTRMWDGRFDEQGLRTGRCLGTPTTSSGARRLRRRPA